MYKVLISGGAGFIGYHLAKRLGYKKFLVDIIDNFSNGLKDQNLDNLCRSPNIRLINDDLLYSDCVNRFSCDYDYIYHFAAILGVSRVMDNPMKVLTENNLITVNLLDIASKQKMLKRFVFASSSEVYDGTLKHGNLNIPTNEESLIVLPDLKHSRTSYMLSKLYGEALCHHSQLPYMILRFFNIYGPRMGMSHVIPQIIQRVYNSKEGDKVQVYSSKHKRSFCFVDDAISIILDLVKSPHSLNQLFNIGNPKPSITIEELAKIIIKNSMKNLEINRSEDTPGSPIERQPDISKLMNIVNHRAFIPIESGIEDTYKWYKRFLA